MLNTFILVKNNNLIENSLNVTTLNGTKIEKRQKLYDPKLCGYLEYLQNFILLGVDVSSKNDQTNLNLEEESKINYALLDGYEDIIDFEFYGLTDE